MGRFLAHLVQIGTPHVLWFNFQCDPSHFKNASGRKRVYSRRTLDFKNQKIEAVFSEARPISGFFS